MHVDARFGSEHEPCPPLPAAIGALVFRRPGDAISGPQMELIADDYDLSGWNFFQRASMQEHLRFLCSEACAHMSVHMRMHRKIAHASMIRRPVHALACRVGVGVRARARACVHDRANARPTLCTYR